MRQLPPPLIPVFYLQKHDSTNQILPFTTHRTRSTRQHLHFRPELYVFDLTIAKLDKNSSTAQAPDQHATEFFVHEI